MTSLEKFVGSMVGAALGDAIGRPFEGSAPVAKEEIEKVILSSQILKVTDDTLMSLDVARSIAEKGRIDPDDLIKRFVQSYDPTRGYGVATTLVLKEVKDGADWREITKVVEESSWGNGAAMRVSPVGLFFCHDISSLLAAAEQSSIVTHSHPLAIEGAKLQAKAVALAITTDFSEFDKFDFLSSLIEGLESEAYREKLSKIEEFLKRGASKEDIISQLGNGSEALNSVPTAIYAFLANAGDFRSTVLQAVSLGGDTDTIASMSGGIAGALLDLEGIPVEWVRKLEMRDEIEKVARDLFFTHVRKVLGERCEVCLSEEFVEVHKLNEEAGNEVSNFILLCRACYREMEREKKEFFVKPRKHGKYRAVYRKAHRGK